MRSSEAVAAAPQLAGSKRKFHAVDASSTKEQDEARQRLLGAAFFTSALMNLVPLQQLLKMLPKQPCPPAATPNEQDGTQHPSKRRGLTQLCGAPAAQAKPGDAATMAQPALGSTTHISALGHPAAAAGASQATMEAAQGEGGQGDRGAPQPAGPEEELQGQEQEQHGDGSAKEGACGDAMEIDASLAPQAEQDQGSQEPAAMGPPASAAAALAEELLPDRFPQQPHIPLSAQKPLSRAQLRQQLLQKRSAAPPTTAPPSSAGGPPLSSMPARGKPTRGNRLLGLARQQHAVGAPAGQPAGQCGASPPRTDLCSATGAGPEALAAGGDATPGTEQVGGDGWEASSGAQAAEEEEDKEEGGCTGARGGESCKQPRQQGSGQRRLTQSPYRFAGRGALAAQGGDDAHADAQPGARQQLDGGEQQARQEPGSRANPQTSTPTEPPAAPDAPGIAPQGGVPAGGQPSAPIPAAAAAALIAGGAHPLAASPDGAAAAARARAQCTPGKAHQQGGASQEGRPGLSPLLPGSSGRCSAAAMRRVGQLAADLADGEEDDMAADLAPVQASAPLLAGTCHLSKRRRSLLGAMSQGGAAARVGSPCKLREGPAAAACAGGTQQAQQGQQQQRQQSEQQAPQLPSLTPSPQGFPSLNPASSIGQADIGGALPGPSPPPACPQDPFPGFWPCLGCQPSGAASAATPLGTQGAPGPTHAESTPEIVGFVPRQVQQAQHGEGGKGAAGETGAPGLAGREKQAQGAGSPGRAGRKERKVRFNMPAGAKEEDEEDGSQPGPTLTHPPRPQAAGPPGTPAKHPLPKMRIPLPPAYSRFGSTAFRRYNGPAGRRAALLSFVSDGSNCVALGPTPPYLPASPLGAGMPDPFWGDADMAEDDVAAEGASGAEGAGGSAVAGTVNIPRRLRNPPATRRLSLAQPPSPKEGCGGALQDLREAFLNARLAESWAAGEGWARLDLTGVELQPQHAPEYVRRLEELCAALWDSQGQEGAGRAMAQLEGEWRHLQCMRQRYAAGAAGAPAPEAADGLSQEGSPPAATPRAAPRAAAPRGILKQPSPRPHQPPPCPRSPGASPRCYQGGLPACPLPAQQEGVEVERGASAMKVCLPLPPAAQPACQPGAAAQEAQAQPRGGAEEEGGQGTMQQAQASESAGQGVGGDQQAAGVEAERSMEGGESQPAPEEPLQLTPDTGGEDSTPEGPLELTPDAAVELTPGRAPSRGLKMMQSAGGTGGTPRALPPACVTLVFPSAKEGAGRGVAAAVPVGAQPAPVAARRHKASRGARLLQALQAGGHRGTAAGAPSCGGVSVRATGTVEAERSRCREGEAPAGSAV